MFIQEISKFILAIIKINNNGKNKLKELIECLSPNEKRYRFYQVSKKGKEILKDVK